MRLSNLNPVRLCLTLLFIAYSLSAYPQTVNEVLGDGIVVKKNERIFIFRQGSNLLYDISITPINFSPYKDSSLFLLGNKDVNIFLPPLNPLRYSYETATIIVADPIMDDADKAFATIGSLLTTVTTERVAPGITPPPVKGKATAANTCICQSCKIDEVTRQITSIVKSLDNDMKNRIKKSFNILHDLSFEQQKRTRDTLNQVKDSIDLYKEFYNELEKRTTELQNDVNSFKCSSNDSLVTKYVLIQILKELKSTYNTQRTRLDNMLKAYALCDKVATNAESPSPQGYVWYENPVNVGLERKKISVFTVTINYSGLEIKDDEIVTTTVKPFVKHTMRFRRFQRFIPEVSTGIVYTMLKYPKFGTTTDANGQQVVSDAGEETFKKLNITGMINFVYFASNSNVNPILQIGIGTNTDYPVLLTGIGIRLNMANLNRLTFSVGGASSWIKSLNKLKIGDPITGTSQLEEDYIYEFKAPKLYFGIQYNF